MLKVEAANKEDSLALVKVAGKRLKRTEDNLVARFSHFFSLLLNVLNHEGTKCIALIQNLFPNLFSAEENSHCFSLKFKGSSLQGNFLQKNVQGDV